MNISLIIPCYNEELNIQKGVLDKIGNFTKNDKRFNEVLIIDDGSNDTTKKIIKEKYLSQFPKFCLIEKNHQGKAFAIITGIKKAKGEFVLFSDIDLATPIEEANKIIQEVEKGYPIVIGSRTSRREGAPVTRKLLAVGFVYIRNFIFGFKGIRDTQCGFKIFERQTAIRIIEKTQVFKSKRKVQGPSVTAAFDLEFLFLASKLGYKIKEVPVIWRHVETKNVNFFKDAYETLKDILKIKFYYLKNAYKLENVQKRYVTD